jgi:hypothetical protein
VEETCWLFGLSLTVGLWALMVLVGLTCAAASSVGTWLPGLEEAMRCFHPWLAWEFSACVGLGSKVLELLLAREGGSSKLVASDVGVAVRECKVGLVCISVLLSFLVDSLGAWWLEGLGVFLGVVAPLFLLFCWGVVGVCFCCGPELLEGDLGRGGVPVEPGAGELTLGKPGESLERVCWLSWSVPV